MAAYSRQYYDRLKNSAFSSANVVVPLVLDWLHPQSVVDVGCGTAEWAAIFKRHGVPTILGIDGEHVDRRTLAISADEFLAADLTQPLAINRQFDIAVSLEVAEHLPSDRARQFVASLTGLAPAVLFSAAIPHQGGEQHVNEQWPQYWTEQFSEYGYVAFDILRPIIWSNPSVQWWYAQNMMLYLDRQHVARFPQLQSNRSALPTPALVHPGCFLQLAWKRRVMEAILELVRVTPTNARILVVDEAQLGDWPEIGRQVWQFTEREGVYDGPPEDSPAALRHLRRHLECGANYIAFAWPAFWWLDHYVDFAQHLRSRFREIVRTENWVVFALSDSPLPNEGN